MATIDDILDRKAQYGAEPTEQTPVAEPAAGALAEPTEQKKDNINQNDVNNPNSIPAVKTPAAQKAVQQNQIGGINRTPVQPASYADIMAALKGSQDDITADEEKRKKREAMFAAIGSGLSAMSNLYTASTGGLDVYDPEKGMAAEHKSRWDKLRDERKKDNDDYINLQMRAIKMDRDDAAAERKWQNTLEQQRLAAEARDREYNRRLAKDDATNAANAAAAKAKAEVEAANAARKDRELAMKEKTAAAQRSKYYAEAQRIKSATSGNRKTITYDIDGERFEVPAANMSDPVTIARLYNMLDEDVRREVGQPIYDITGNNIIGHKPATMKDMQAAIGVHLDSSPALQDELRALAGRQRKPQRKANPMGSSANGKKRNPMN